MTVNIGVLELQSHPNCLSHTARICNADDATVTVFSHVDVVPETGDDLQSHPDIDVHLQDGEPLDEYLRTVESFCADEIDLLLINSLFGDLRRLRTYAEFTPDCRSLLRLHSINLWFEERLESLDGKAGELGLALRQHILDIHDGVLTGYRPLLEYLRTETDYSGRSYDFVPVYNQYGRADDESDVLFTVPGRIDPDRKDYETTLDAFELVARRTEDCRLCLLGHVRDDEGGRILDRCDRLNDRLGDRIDYYRDSEWVPESEFVHRMRSTDVVLSTVEREYTKKFMRETYGTTKTSGNVRDAIRFATPLVLPDHFEVSESIREMAITYRDAEELADLLHRLATDEAYLNEAQRGAADTAERFTLARQRRRLKAIRDDVLGVD